MMTVDQMMSELEARPSDRGVLCRLANDLFPVVAVEDRVVGGSVAAVIVLVDCSDAENARV